MGHLKTLLASLPWAEYQSPSLQIGSLSAYARKEGYDVKALHLHLDGAVQFGLDDYDFVKSNPPTGEAICAALLFPGCRKDLVDAFEAYVPNMNRYIRDIRRVLKYIYAKVDWGAFSLIGFPITYSQLFSTLLIASWIKRDHPETRIIIGGRCVAGKLGFSVLRHFPQIDWCVDGEGEIALVDLLGALKRGENDFENGIPGLIYRSGEEINCNQRRQLISLDGLPDPDYDHYFELEEGLRITYGCNVSPYLPIEESRGCRYRCAFCCHHSYYSGYRIRPTAEIERSIKRMSAQHRTASATLIASTVETDRRRELFDRIASHGRDYSLFCEIRATASKEDLLSMKRAGISEVQIGIEALDTSLLKKMNKGTRLIDNLQAMKYCEEMGITQSSNLIIEFPTESQSDIDRTIKAIDYASAYSPPCQLAQFQLFDGSSVYLLPKNYGVSEINEAGCVGSLLPADMAAEIILWHKDFRSKRKQRNYKELKMRCKLWRDEYYRIRSAGRHPLLYRDCGEFLRIEDHREEPRSLILDGWMRKLYLFCDSMRSWDEIRNRFSKCEAKLLKRSLNKLCKLRFVFREGDCYLSLAVRSSKEWRHNESFQ